MFGATYVAFRERTPRGVIEELFLRFLRRIFRIKAYKCAVRIIDANSVRSSRTQYREEEQGNKAGGCTEGWMKLDRCREGLDARGSRRWCNY